MKKLLFLLVLLFCTRLSFAVTDLSGHFGFDLSSNQIEVSSITQYFSKYLDLPANTTFDMFRSETDTAGYQHFSFQQYVDSMPVEGAMVLVHARNGIVQSMNGEVLTSAKAAKLPSGKRQVSARAALSKVGRPDANVSNAEQVLVKVLEGGRYVYHKTYRIMAKNFSKYEYVDIYTGEIVKNKSLVFNVDVQGTAYTMYNGVVPFTCVRYTDGYYYLQDEGRNFSTLDASKATPIDYEHLVNLDSTMYVYLSSCSNIADTSSTWNLSYHRFLKYLSITSLPAWTPQTGDSLPNLYIKIYSSSDQLLYTGSCVDDAVLPVTFEIPDGVEAQEGALHVYVYHRDSLVGDSSICDFTLPYYLSYVAIPIDVPSVIMGYVKFEEVGYQPALDIHWGMQKTMDFYREKLNRHGHDNKNSVLYQLYNPQQDSQLFATMPANAFAYYGTTPNIMAYGVGEIIYGDTMRSMGPVVDLDVMAHEFTHLVTAHNGHGGLNYEDESGALNESFSDVMAMGVTNYASGVCLWQIGQNIMTYASDMRSMSNPNLSGLKAQPKYYEGLYWADMSDHSASGDYGGVHTNSGVQNYWFYLLCHGGSGYNEHGDYFDVSGIGMDKAIQIAYMNLLYYLTPNAGYMDARWGTEQVAKELFGEHSQEYRAVVDAWNAVGVEEPFVSKCKTLPYSEPFASSQGNFTIENVALDGLNYVWQFASGYGMKASAYVGSVNHTTESWLISPCLDLPEDSTDIRLTFDHVHRFTNTPSTDLTLLIAEDYIAGEPVSKATWIPLTIPAYSSGNDWTFVNAGTIDLSAYAGSSVTLAFCYKSSSSAAGTWEIKNVSVTSHNIIMGLDEAFRSHGATKCIMDGRLIILRNGHKYTATGLFLE